MVKKSFDTETATNKFFTKAEPVIEAPQVEPIQPDQPKKKGRPLLSPENKKRGTSKRLTLVIDYDLIQFLHEIAWEKRCSMTQYINDLIRRDYEAYIEQCKEAGKNPFEGWEDPNDI